MVDVTLTTGGVTFEFQPGDCESCRSLINSGVEANELPASPPAAAMLFDFDGPTKQITLSGRFTEANTNRITPGGAGTVTTILQQKQWVESVINGNQSPIVFTSNYESQTAGFGSATSPYQAAFTLTRVMILTFETTESEGNPNALDFSLTLLAGNL